MFQGVRRQNLQLRRLEHGPAQAAKVVGAHGSGRLSVWRSPGARYWGSEASGAIASPGADSMFSSFCSVISSRSATFQLPDRAPLAAFVEASGQNASKPNQIQTKPDQKMGLDCLGFFRPIRGFSMCYGQSKSKMHLPSPRGQRAFSRTGPDVHTDQVVSIGQPPASASRSAAPLTLLR